MTTAPQATKPAAKSRARKAPVKPLNQTPEQIRTAAKAEKERKAASKKALKTSLAKPEPVKPVIQEPTPEQAAAKAAADHEAYLAALRVDAAALGVDADEYIASQLAPIEKSRYFGPMLILREAAKHYVKAANGNPCNGDQLAQALGDLSREETVKILGSILFTAGVTTSTSPYLHLNPGQQSKNLRNKVRGALKSGTVTLAQIVNAADEARKARA